MTKSMKKAEDKDAVQQQIDELQKEIDVLRREAHAMYEEEKRRRVQKNKVVE